MKPAVIKPKDLRNFSIVPIRAIKDPRVTATMLKVLVAFCSYADRTGRTFVSLERIGDDIGTSQSAVSKQVTKLKKCGYIVNAKPISRQIKTCTRRILYVNKTEAAIRSSLSSSEVMELSIAEDELKNQALIDSNTPANERPEHEVRVLKGRFSVLCDRFFAESVADGWWISTDSQRQTTIQLSNQAVDMLRRDRTAATAPQRG
jgi:biotin operon repressor